MRLRDYMPRLPTFRAAVTGDVRRAAITAALSAVASGEDAVVGVTERARKTYDRAYAAWYGGRRVEAVIDNYGSRAANDDSSFRSLTSKSTLSMSPAARERAMTLSWQLYQTNAPTKNAVDLLTAYTWGDGMTIASDSDAVQAILDAHWMDRPHNDWPSKGKDRFRNLALYGSAIWPRFVGGDGSVRLGWLHPLNVERIERDPENPAIQIGVRMKRDGKGRVLTHPIVMAPKDSEWLSDRARTLRDKWSATKAPHVFCFNVNACEPGEQGMPDGASGFDSAAIMDVLYEEYYQRVLWHMAMVYDVEVEGLTEPNLAKWLAAHRDPPASGTVNVHNSKEKWQALTTESKALDAKALFDLYLENVARSRGVPKHFLASPEDANRATALAMGTPTTRMMLERQATCVRAVEAVLDEVLRQAVAAKHLDAAVLAEKTPYTVTPSVIAEKASDLATKAAAIPPLQIALDAMVSSGSLSHEKRTEILAVVLTDATGVEVDAANELDAISGSVPDAATPADAARTAGEAIAATVTENAVRRAYKRRRGS